MVPPPAPAKTARFSRHFRRFRCALLLSVAGVGALAPAAQGKPRLASDYEHWLRTGVWRGFSWVDEESGSRPLTPTSANDGLIINAPAASQTWLGASGNGGDGVWSTATNWSPNTWVAGNAAVFGGPTAGTVTVGAQTAGGLTFNLGGYTLASGTLTLTTGTAIATNGGTTTFASTLNLGGAGGVALSKTGSGTLSLATSNTNLGTAASPAVWTVTGSTTGAAAGVFDSVLSVTLGNNLGAAPTANATQLILDAGTLEFRGSGADNTNVVGATRTIQINAAGGAIRDVSGFNDTFNGNIVNNAGASSSLYLANKSAVMTLAGAISGGGGVTWNGAGTLALTGANTYTGGTTINAGTLRFTTDANLGNAAGTLTLNGGTLASAQTAAVTLTRSLAVGANGGTIQLNNGTFTTGKITLGNAGQITGSGPLTLANNGLLSIGGANTGYTGNWTLNGGVLELTSNRGAGTGSLTVNAGAELSTLGSQITNPLFLNGGRISWDFYSGSGDYQGPVTLQAGGGVVSLVSFYSGGTSISGTISGNISGAGALSTSNVGPSSTSSGGTLTLSGNNSYTGGTTVGVGTTITAGSATALGASTGALAVAGTLNLNGNSFNVGALTLSDGANFAFTLAANNTTERLTASSVAASGTAYLGFNLANLAGAGTYPLITSTDGSLPNAFGFAGAYNLTVPVSSIITQTSGGSFYRLTLSNTGSGTEGLVVSTDVPSKTLTILPFGSSITAGQSAQNPYNGGGYRQQLYQDLVNDGRFNPTFIGSSTATLANNPTGTTVLATANQGRHEGHPGWTTLQMLANLGMSNGDPGANGGNWLGADNPGYGTPNYVTVNVGGNDAVNYGLTPAAMTAAAQRLDAIVSKINTLRPGSGVTNILSTIAYRGDNGGSYSTQALDPYYNPAIGGIVFNHVLAGQNMGYLDLRTIMNFTTDISSDKIHPTQVGYDKMADAWYQSVAYGSAYWKGGQGTAWNTLNGASTNFAMDAGLTTDRRRTLNDPAANTYGIYPDVYFNGNTAALNTTLGADTTVRSLNFAAGATGPVTIGAGNTLTIGTIDVGADANTPYTLANTGGITVQAGTGAHTVAANVALGADQTWGNVSSNNLTVSGNIGGSYGLSLVGAYTVYNPGTYTPNGTNYQQASYTTTPQTVSGTAGFILSGQNTYTGATTITGVTLRLDNAGSTTPRLAGTSGIVLNPGGSLLFTSTGGSSADRINNNATITLAGGTLNTRGFSEGTVAGTVPTPGLGALTLAASSVLDLGNGASFVTFANSSASAWAGGAVLSVYDWSGSVAGGGADRLFFGADATGLTGAQLGQVAFYSDAGSTFLGYGSILPNGEVVPVPEPATVLGAVLLAGAAGYRLARRRDAK